MRRLLPLAAVAAALLCALGGCGRSPAEGGRAAIHLRYASPYPPGHPFSRADIAWMAQVERDSGGRLKIDPYWGGVTISSDQSLFELRHGVADIALITPIYQRAGVRTIKTQTGFYVGALSLSPLRSARLRTSRVRVMTCARLPPCTASTWTPPSSWSNTGKARARQW